MAGNVNGNQFKTAALWGVGQRVFFLDDRRTSDLLNAIDHQSQRLADNRTNIETLAGPAREGLCLLRLWQIERETSSPVPTRGFARP